MSLWVRNIGSEDFTKPSITGPRSPGTVADDAAFGQETWLNPGNAAASDDSRATVLTGAPQGANSHYLKATNFGFAIPAGSAIVGIKVEVERSTDFGDGNQAQDARVRIVKGGVVGATDKADTLTDWPRHPNEPEAYKSYGGSADLWGETWTVQDINASDFGMVIAAKGDNATNQGARIDHIRITVHYTLLVRKGKSGYDLTNKISGLRFSNVRPGGDEFCSFTFHAPWGASLREIGKGDVIHVGDGIDVLWAGRIEEQDRGGEQSEQIAVTAYGLGARLKDSTIREIYVDRDLGRWQEMSVGRRLAYTIGRVGDFSVEADDASGQPSLVNKVTGPWNGNIASEAWYDAKGLIIGSVYHAWKFAAPISAADSAWRAEIFASTTDLLPAPPNQTGDLHPSGTPGTGTLITTGGNKKWAMAYLEYTAANAEGTGQVYPWFWTVLAPYGNHGLTKRGTESATAAKGFFASDMVEDIAERADGIVVRRLDATTFVIEQMVFLEPTSHEEAVAKVNEYHVHERIWGTWGPDSPLDTSPDGQFDYVALEPTVQHWFATRAECDDLDLHTEMSTLFNQVDVHHRDSSRSAKIETRTAAVPELDEDGITRKARLDGGTLTQAGARRLGDAFLALSGNFAPARGSVTISRPIRHYQRGELPPHYMRADGSNLRIPDILPALSLFELSSDPDRRTTFPLKRVEVDAGGETIKVRAELDQAHDILSALQSRLGLAADILGA